jgi:integrase
MIVVRLGTNRTKGRVYWRAHWTDHLGRRGFKSGGLTSGMTNREALAWCQELAAKLNAGWVAPSAPMTLSQWCERYVAMRSDLAAGTRTMHETTISYMREVVGDKARLRSLTPHDGDRWVTHLREKGLGAQTVCAHVRNAKVILSWAVDRKLIHENPWRHLVGSARKSERPWKMHTGEEVLRLIDSAPSPAWRALLALCSLGGMRRDLEAREARWDHIYWDRARIAVWDSEGLTGTKRRRREVYMSPVLERILLELRDEAEGELIVGDLGARDLHRAMVGKVVGIPGTDLDRHIPGLVQKAGLEVYAKPFHTLRKWRASTWVGMFPVPFVSEWIGDRVETLMRHYIAQPIEYIEEEREAARRLGYGTPMQMGSTQETR